MEEDAATAAAASGSGQQQSQPQHSQHSHYRSAGAASAREGTFYIQDVLAWRGYSLVDCTAEFRLYWLQSKLAEEASAGSGAGSSAAAGGWQLDGGGAVPGHDCRCASSVRVCVV
jgi:hypothetical protein